MDHQAFLFLALPRIYTDGAAKHVHAAAGCGSINEAAESRRLPGDLIISDSTDTSKMGMVLVRQAACDQSRINASSLLQPTADSDLL
jgi:hypothetical protein